MGFNRSYIQDEYGAPSSSDDSTPPSTRGNKKPKKTKRPLKPTTEKRRTPAIQKSQPNNPNTLGR